MLQVSGGWAGVPGATVARLVMSRPPTPSSRTDGVTLVTRKGGGSRTGGSPAGAPLGAAAGTRGGAGRDATLGADSELVRVVRVFVEIN